MQDSRMSDGSVALSGLTVVECVYMLKHTCIFSFTFAGQ